MFKNMCEEMYNYEDYDRFCVLSIEGSGVRGLVEGFGRYVLGCVLEF